MIFVQLRIVNMLFRQVLSFENQYLNGTKIILFFNNIILSKLIFENIILILSIIKNYIIL